MADIIEPRHLGNNVRFVDNGDGTWSEKVAATVTGAPTALGQATMANSMPVVIASDQSALPIAPGTSATSLGKAEDAVSASGDTGVAMLGVRRDTNIIPAGTDLDYGMVSLDKYGAVQVSDRRRQARWYSAAAIGVVAVASAGTVFTVAGNANTKVFVTKVKITGVHATGNLIDVLARKYSTAFTGGTATTKTAIPHDSGDAAGQAVVSAYTANPTPGTNLGELRAEKLAVPAATALANTPLEFVFGENGGKGILLGSASEVLSIHLNAVTTGATLNFSVEWFEVDA
jgi:hypothetical protein